jgi:hypothetical protein
MIIGIIGCRARDTQEDCELVEKELLKLVLLERELPVTFSIVSGGCPKGGDRFAEKLADKHSIDIKLYPADWNKYGKSAGFRRNGDIARDADILIACVAPDRKGGTEDTISKFLALGKKELILV